MLSAACPFSRKEREGDTLRSQQARYQVGDGNTHSKRSAVGVASDAHQAAFGLDDGVVAGLIATGTVLTEPGDGADNEPVMLLSQCGVIKTNPRHCSRPEVLDEHIGAFNQAVQDP